MPGAEFDVESIALRPMSLNALPPAAETLGRLFYVHNAPGGPSMVISDGVSYRPFARGTQTALLETSANGKVVWAFPTPFAEAPGVFPVVLNPAGGQPYMPELESVTKTQVTVALKRSRTLPSNLLSLVGLQGLDIFGGAVGAGVKVYLFATPLTA